MSKMIGLGHIELLAKIKLLTTNNQSCIADNTQLHGGTVHRRNRIIARRLQELLRWGFIEVRFAFSPQNEKLRYITLTSWGTALLSRWSQ